MPDDRAGGAGAGAYGVQFDVGACPSDPSPVPFTGALVEWGDVAAAKTAVRHAAPVRRARDWQERDTFI
jgi:hypothetical protein